MGDKKQHPKLTEADSVRRDEYDGKYKKPKPEKSPWPDTDLPVKHDPLAAKNLKSFGAK